MQQVNLVLEEIGAEKVPQIQIFNKIDLIDSAVPRVDRDERGRVRRIWISSVTGAGLEELRAVLHEVCFDKPGLERYSDDIDGEHTDFIEAKVETDDEDAQIA